MDNARWIAQAEAAIEGLPDVESACIKAMGDTIREVHVLTRSERPAKKIVRDIQTLLLTLFRREIDHRVVSIVAQQPSGKAVVDPDSNGHEVVEVVEEPLRVEKAHEAEDSGTEPGPERIRFGSVNVYVSGRRAQAQVELRWKGVPRMGSASGWSTRDSALRLVAQATVATVQEFLDEGIAFGLDAVDVVRIGRHEVAVVGLELLAHRSQKGLVGCCTIEADAQQAVVLATLSALNRVVGGLPTKEPTEYVLRPTSS